MARLPVRAIEVGLLLAAVLGAGCGDDPPIAGERVTSGRGALSTVLPEGWKVGYSFRLTDPAGEGISVDDATGPRLIVYASVTALADFVGDDPTNRSVYTFRHLQAMLGQLDAFDLGEGCTREAITPIEGADFYGQLRVMTDCQGGLASEVRGILIDARRTTVLWVTVGDGDPGRARRIAQLVLDHVEIDPAAVPRKVAVTTTFTD